VNSRIGIALGAAVLIVLLGVTFVPQARSADMAVPDALKDWREWVLQGEEYRKCPFLAGQDPASQSSYRCAWPERLDVSVDAKRGEFRQQWSVLADSWIAVPGNAEIWPRNVLVNGRAAAVVLRSNRPQLRLPAGDYTLTGSFVWSSRPESLPVPAQTALVVLVVDGQAVAQPERPDGALWLGKRASAVQTAAMDLQVYRLVRDESPVHLTTRIRLQVAGDAREETLGRVLPDGFVPLGLSSELPARLDQNGQLRVQVRPGAHEIELTARGQDVAKELTRPAPDGKWPSEEVWSFAGNDRLRVAAPEGAPGIDPAQANVPNDWRQLPAFRMAPDTTLRVDERSRGLANADGNNLSLKRSLWLSFDHSGFTAVDTISGQLRSDWRLDMAAPFRLESARLGGEPLLVTESGEEGQLGVELRTPNLQLTTTARTASTRASLAATGWTQRFDDVSGELYLPPGHLLLAVPGADFAFGAWLNQWGLWNVFGVIVVVFLIHWAAGWRVAALALLGLALTYQEQPLFIWLWANLLAALAIARAAPEGRFRRIAQGYRTASFVVLGLALLPFLWGQLRVAIHPQLEAGTAAFGSQQAWGGVDMSAAAPEILMQEPASDAAVEEAVSESAGSMARRDRSQYAPPVRSKANVQAYAPGTLLQAGPGIPAWRYRAYTYGWSGPVEPEQTVRFVYLGPMLLFFWRVIGVLALAGLFLWLARLSYGSIVRLPRHAKASSPAAAGLLLGVLALGSLPALAATTPDAALLTELRNRLVAPPACQPNCAEIAFARVDLQGDRLIVTLQASALTGLAIGVPQANDRWQLDEVSVNGRGAVAIAREADGSLWVPLQSGASTIRLSGRLAAAESIQLAFPQQPRAISVNAQGWAVGGVNDGRMVSGSLELTRERRDAQASGSASLEAASEFPAFVRVARTIDLDTDWRATTTVSRVAPARAAITVAVPLIPGESVVTAGPKVQPDRTVLVGIAATEASVAWNSVLPRTESLALTMPAGAARTEVWNFRVGPEWRADFAGLPAVQPDNMNGGTWVYQFYPRPGETLQLGVSRPQPAAGATLAIDSVNHRRTIGKRSSSSSLSLTYRSTQGGRHTIGLPTDARVEQVQVDGQPLQLRPENGELSLPLLPGEHRVAIEWTDSVGEAFRNRPAPVDLRAPASNIATSIQSEARWHLAALGDGVGPVILYWSEFIAFLLVAWMLSRWRDSPLRLHEWLLLGIGLSTASWGLFVLVAGWLCAMRWRERWSATTAPKWFNTVQVLLGLLTFVALMGILFWGIRNGLLGSPEMGIAGPGSGDGTFTWFNDQSSGALPQPTLISVPMWVFNVLMLVWAIWIAASLVQWLKWAFGAWTSQGFWRGKVVVPGAAA